MLVCETVTSTVTVALFESLIVTVHDPLSAPPMTVKVTAAPGALGVALVAGLICATNALLAGVGVGTGLGFGEHTIVAVNAAV